MNFAGISPGSLLLIFLIILVIFGTKKLRSIGEDLGQAFKGFRKGLQTNEESKSIINNDDKSLEK
ncbi:MAG: twin-arginine translocase TatA/TatE family subunit [Candidatus Azosocius agrarius]|nr:MAG: twin-arginine translocase TatA/TatE family subunit [Gammaproteobacteria bacterium]